MRAVLIAALFVPLSLVAHPGHAAGLDKTLTGAELDLKSLCAKHVSIEPQDGLAGKVLVAATATRQEELDQLTFSEGDKAGIGHSGSECWHTGYNFRPSLDIVIKVPAKLALQIHEGGTSDYAIGAVGGALKVTLSGSGSVKAANVTDLDVAISGSGDAVVDQLGGPAVIQISGSGDLKIGAGTAPNVKLKLSGSGSVSYESGAIGALEATISGSADIKIKAAVTDAQLRVSGSGDITLAQVTGKLTQHASGSGTIRVGGS